VRRFLLAAGLAALGLALAGPSASAHALLSSSEPAANAALDRAPERVSLTFTERPDLTLSLIRVLDGSGRDVEQGSARSVPGADRSLYVALRPLERGVFTVTWRTTSAVDGHTTAGSFSFGVGIDPASAAPPPAAPSTPRPTPAGAAGRWLLYVGLSLLVGAAATGLALGAGRWPGWPMGLGAGLAAAGLVMTALDQRALAHVGMGALLRSRTGHRLVLQAVAVVVAGALAAAWSLRRSRLLLAAAGAAGAAAMLARARAGHASASSVPWFTVGVQWAHLAAVGAWVGGLPFLLIALRSAGPADRPVIARRFSRLAAYGLLVVVVTGTLRAVAEVGAWRRLTTTGFGQALLIKLAAVAVLVALGAISRFRHVRAATTGLRRTVVPELVAGAAVLGVTAVLTGLAPPASIASARRAATPAALVVSGHDVATAVRAGLSVTPGTVGPNRFDLTLSDYDTGRPLAASAVRLRFRFLDRSDVPEGSITLEPGRAGHWTGAGAVLALDGRWRVTAAADTASGGVEVPMTLEPNAPPQKVEVQRTPGLPTIFTVTDGAGRKAQIYLDPGRPGANELHVTGLDPAGAELRVTDMALSVRGPGDLQASSIDARRLDPEGHFVADLDARRGSYDIRVTATLADGAVLRARARIPVG
jgi:copper transport protein